MIKKKTISAEILKENGYTEYKPNHFQKKFTDKKGVKFFIKAVHDKFDFQKGITSWWTFSMQFDTERGSVEISTVQWFNKDGIYSQTNFLHAERYLEKMWIANGKPYYKKYKKGGLNSSK